MAENDELEEKIKQNKEKFGIKVHLLYAGDNTEWETVYKEVVLVALRFHTKNGHCFGKIIKDRGLCAYDVLSELYQLMVGEKKLGIYAYKGDLYVWMQSYIKGIVRKACKDRAIVTDPDDLENVPENSSNMSENHQQSSNMDETSKSSMLKTSALERAYAKLFKANPEGAYILLLHGREGLTFNAICGVLGLPQDKSHINHVDNAFRQAQEEIKRILKQQQN